MKKFLIFITVLFFCENTFSQEYNTAFYSTETSNIVSNSIADFEFDNNGNVWITHGSPQNGVSMFNGTSFVNYIPNINIPTDVTFEDIEIDSNNNIWVLVWQKFEYGYNNGCNCYPTGYSQALLFFDGTNWEYYTPSNSELPTISYGSIKTDSIGNVWFITNDGLSKFDGTDLTVYNPPISTLPSPANFYENNFMEIDDNDIIWIVSNGLISFNNENWILYPSTNFYFGAVLTIHNNNIYLGAYGSDGSLGAHFIKFDGNTYMSYTESYENCDLSNDVISPIGFCYLDFDSQGNLWAGFCPESYVDNEYIGIKNLTDCTYYLTGINLSYSKLKIDNQDNIWMRSGWYEGLVKMSPNNLNTEEYILTNKLLYPNPATNEITIINTQDSKYEYYIYDISGKLVQNNKALYNQPIDISQLQQGVYVLKTISDDNGVEIHKLVKK